MPRSSCCDKRCRPRHRRRCWRYLVTLRIWRTSQSAVEVTAGAVAIAKALGHTAFEGTLIDIAMIDAQIERERLDGVAHRAEKHRCFARVLRLPGPICLVQAASATAGVTRRGKCLSSGRIQAIFTSDGASLRECPINRKSG